MAGATKLELPFSSIDIDDLVSVFYQLSDYIAIHEIVCDEWGSIVDTRLMWWNKHYEDIRKRPVILGQRMTETYFRPHVSLAHIAEACATGHSLQLFEMGEETRSYYNPEDGKTKTWINWQRLGDHIVEVGCDLDEASELQNLIENQRTLLAIAGRKRAIAVERERIARNLHDVVIQNLYATSLALAVSGRDKDDETKMAFDKAINAIDGVIAEIRREILHVESHKATPLRLMLEDILIPVLTPTETGLELLLEVSSLPQQVEPHVRAVCIEAASNAVRHGGASLLKIRISRVKQDLVLTIEDNGCGIPSQARLQNGLHNMRERAESLGGNMEIHTKSKGGTTLKWSVPCRGCSVSAPLCKGCE